MIAKQKQLLATPSHSPRVGISSLPQPISPPSLSPPSKVFALSPRLQVPQSPRPAVPPVPRSSDFPLSPSPSLPVSRSSSSPSLPLKDLRTSPPVSQSPSRPLMLSPPPWVHPFTIRNSPVTIHRPVSPSKGFPVPPSSRYPPPPSSTSLPVSPQDP